MPRTLAPLGALGVAALLLTSCASADGSSNGSSSTGATDDGPVKVLASFYPLQYVAEQVGGDRVDVSSLTPPGTEPHDVELSPRQVRSLSETDLVLYLSGFQNAVDEAIEARAPARVLDAADVADLLDGGGPGGAHAGEEAHTDEDAHTDDEAHTEEEAHTDEDAHTDDEAAEDDHGHGHGHEDALDPHFWLDPQRLATLAEPVADALAEVDPDNADAYAEGAARLTAELTELDEAYTAGLADCERRVVVTSHEAFGYLAAAYDLEQVGISGLDPEAEPSPARLREIGDVVRAEGVTTLFTESLVNPKVAETLASDLGVETALLDPVESQTEPDADYRDVMEQNLEALRAGLGCA